MATPPVLKTAHVMARISITITAVIVFRLPYDTSASQVSHGNNNNNNNNNYNDCKRNEKCWHTYACGLTVDKNELNKSSLCVYARAMRRRYIRGIMPVQTM